MKTERRELKYLIPVRQYQALEPRLRQVMRPDSAGGPTGAYHVRSLYFDSLHDDDYFDVLRGAKARKKIRLRVYPAQRHGVKLEYKFKQGVHQRKTSISLTRVQARRMIAGDYGFLENNADPLAMTICREMVTRTYRPKVLIEYDRQAYTVPGSNIRFTFDTSIRASRNCYGLFSRSVDFVPLIAQDKGVLEIKYSGVLPSSLQEILRGLDALPAAKGKYTLCRTGLR